MTNKIYVAVEVGDELKFGDYVLIEQKRHGYDNEMYVHKAIGILKSNYYVDVPVQSPATETLHQGVVPVVRCICCGVSETEVLTYRIADVKYLRSELPNNLKEITLPDDDELKNIFTSQSDCYADTHTVNPDDTFIEGDVIQAMTLERFKKVINNFILGKLGEGR